MHIFNFYTIDVYSSEMKIKNHALGGGGGGILTFAYPWGEFGLFNKIWKCGRK